MQISTVELYKFVATLIISVLVSLQAITWYSNYLDSFRYNMYIQVNVKLIILITTPGYIMQQRISANHTLSPCFIVTCDDMIQFMTGNKWPITVVKLSCYIIVSCCDNFFSSNFVINVITSCKFLNTKLFILYNNISHEHIL